MAILDDELINDAAMDAEIVAHITNVLPQELKTLFTEELLYYFHDLIEEFLAESGILESEPDEEGFVNVDVEQIALHLQKQATKDKMGSFDLEDLFHLVEAELSYGDDFED